MHFDTSAAFQPYSANDLLAIVFLTQSVLFALSYRRTGENYFFNLSIGTFLAMLAWGTTRFQQPGLPHVNWEWFWAQPLFAGMLATVCAGMLQYLPLSPNLRKKLLWMVVVPQVLYITITTALLLLDIKVLRLWVILMQMPSFFVAGIAAIACEKKEKGIGHFIIGLAILSVPAITVGVAFSGATTLVLRFWTGIPALLITQVMMIASLLRDRQQLALEVLKRQEAELSISRTNATLERKVQERTAELKDVIQALESFNRNVSHDLRGPLGGIDMMSFIAKQHLEKGDINAAQEQLRLISDQVRESQSTVNSMLLLARTYDQELNHVDLDITEIARSAAREAYLSLTAGIASRHMPELEVHQLGRATIDASMLRIVLINLISNALKFNMDRFDVKVSVGREQASNQLVIFVEDNGNGFDTRGANQMFEAFQRLSNASQIPGLGLGLNIVKLAVERLGGKVQVISSPGKGARFTVRLPLNNPN